MRLEDFSTTWPNLFSNNAPINVKPVNGEGGGGGGRQGIGQGFDIFQRIDVKFPTPRQKCEVKYN